MLAANLCKDALLLWSLSHLARVAVQLALNLVELHLGIELGLVHGHADAVAELVKLVGKRDDGGRRLRGTIEQTAAIERNLVVFCDERGYGYIGDTHIGRQHGVVLARIHSLAQAVDKFNLHLGLRQLLLVLACVEYVLACIELDVNQLVALLVALQRPFGAAQLGVELFDTVVDKLLGTASYLILVLIGILIVTAEA